MKHVLILLCISSVILSSCMKKEGGANDAQMRTDSIKAKNMDGMKAVLNDFNTGKLDDLGNYIDANMIDHQLQPGQKPGLAGVKEVMGMFRTAFPDLKFTVQNMIADTNYVWTYSTLTGTNTGSMMGMPPTNKPMNVEVFDLVKIVNGKAVEHWGVSDDAKLMQQMGLMPPMGGAPPPGGDMKKDDMKKGK